MKNLVLALFTITTLVTTGCVCKKNKMETTEQNQESVTVTGKMTLVTNGKDGYTAVLQTANNKVYNATISRINLQKSGSEYKRYEEGETITVSGFIWVDTEGVTYITVTELQ